MKKGITKTAALAVLAMLGPMALMPATAEAQSSRRQQTKNEWRNLAIGGGALALYGLLKKDSTLTFVGSVGALYSAYRYEQDRKSQSRMDRARAQLFSRSSFTDGKYRYVRRTKWKSGKKYYYFTRTQIKSR